MKKHRATFQAYRHADAKVRKAKNGKAPQSQHENAKDKHRKGHNAFMAAYTRRKRLVKLPNPRSWGGRLPPGVRPSFLSPGMACTPGYG